MAKKLLLLFTLVSVMACTQRDTAEQGVVINGVRWATRNVDTPGTFTANPQDFGGYFNRIQAQSACPEGWRMPTRAELMSLATTPNTWTNQGGTNGQLFGTETHQIFLPASGIRQLNELRNTGLVGLYWGYTASTGEMSAMDIMLRNRGDCPFFVFLAFDFYGDMDVDFVSELDDLEYDLLISLRCVAMTNEEIAQARRNAELQREIEARTIAEQGVVINNVRWATRNVDAPGTFVENPEDAGMFFQWNRRQGWSARGAYVSNWDSSNDGGITWRSGNDPCPQGWRVPTETEIYSLYDSGSTWMTKNGINGRLFGNVPNQIFLPATGAVGIDGLLRRAGEGGSYWSSQNFRYSFARNLQFCDNYLHIFFSSQAVGHSVRCVAK